MLCRVCAVVVQLEIVWVRTLSRWCWVVEGCDVSGGSRCKFVFFQYSG